jgi:hypothetical protein
MSKDHAKKLFAPYLDKDCEVCPAKKGELCDTPAVWVHATRMTRLRHKEPIST